MLTLKNGDPDYVVPGLMALGEAACVSVHGANRLGSNSLIDLVVFGRAAGLRCAEIVEPGEKHADLPDDVGRQGARPPRPLPPRQGRHADGGAAPQDAADDAGRTAPCSAPARCWRRARAGSTTSGAAEADIHVTDRSLIWNTDLIETLEFDNLIAQAVVTMESALQPHREPRRPCPRGLPERDDKNWMKHTLAWLDDDDAQGDASTTARCTPTR